MGVLADKDYEKMITMMYQPGDRVYTVTPQNPRALDGKELEKQLFGQNIDAQYCENIQDAVLYALRDAQKEDMILALDHSRICGMCVTHMRVKNKFTKNNLM